MNYKKFNIPATLIHEIKGKKYRLKGTMTAIDEANNLCTMTFGDKSCNVVPLEEIYLSESLWDKIKSGVGKIKGTFVSLVNCVIKKVKGFLLPVDGKGNVLSQYINIPANMATVDLGPNIMIAPSAVNIQALHENGIATENCASIDDIVATEEARVSKEGNAFWGKVIKEYATNESLVPADAVKTVLERQYQRVFNPKERVSYINEKAIPTLEESPIYGRAVSSKQLQAELRNHFRREFVKDGFGYAPPYLIWGAPGIGKTAIIKAACQQLNELYGLNLDLIYVNCTGLHPDEFSLPKDAKNAFAENKVVTAPISWLPVYTTQGLTSEQIKEVDEYYNSGRYAKGLSKPSFMNDSNEDNASDNREDKIFNGGIIFLDEFARVEPQTLNILMALVNERKYKELTLASKYIFVMASNTHTDDFEDIDSPRFNDMWTAAQDSRYEMRRLIPKLSEWLTWARDINPKTGTQNIDEMFCKFIEQKDEGVWYKTLEKSFEDIEDKEIVSDELKKAIKDKNYQAIETMINSPEHNKDRYSHGTWNPRTWQKGINDKIMGILQQLLGPKDYIKCFTETTRTKYDYSKGEEVEYQVKNIDMDKLEKMLNKINNVEWFDFAEAYTYNIKDVSPKDRIAFFKEIISTEIGNATGEDNSMVLRKWVEYNNWSKEFTKDVLAHIWQKGNIGNSEWDKEDNICYTPSQRNQYTLLNHSAWKAQTEMVNKVFNLVTDFNNYPDGLTGLKDMLKHDIEVIRNTCIKNGGLSIPTEREITLQKSKYSYTLIKDKKSYNTSVIDPENNESTETIQEICKVLKYSEVAQYFANIGMWIIKVSNQAHTGYGAHDIIETINTQFNKFIVSNGINLDIVALAKDYNVNFDFLRPFNQILSHYANLNMMD